MAGLLRSARVTDEQRLANDRQHRPVVVLAVVAVLAAYVYLLSEVSVEISWLPRPVEAARTLGLEPDHVFDEDSGKVATRRYISLTQHDLDGDSFLIYYLIAIAAFLSAYYLPLRFKNPALCAWSIVALVALYGPVATAGLVATLVALYQVLHPRPGLGHSMLTGVLGSVAFGHYLPGLWPPASLVLYPLVWSAGFHFVVRRALEVPRLAPRVRTIAVQSSGIVVCLGAVVQGLGGEPWQLPVGVLLFCWLWERVIFYHVDYKNGQVPEDITLGRFLSNFLTLGAVPYWEWGGEIGQGYAYANNGLLCEEKNRIVLSGVRILLVALFYLVFWEFIRYRLIDFFDLLGVDIHKARTSLLVRHYTAGDEVTTASVLFATLADQIRWMLMFAGMTHFRVGMWRICGYRIDPYFNKPWLATNLVTFWARYTFHYREFLVRAFYYPVFFRYFKKNRNVRIVVATFAAAGLGNMIWGHLIPMLYGLGLDSSVFGYTFAMWPYFVLLSAGISVTELYLLRKKNRRKPWTGGWRIAGDVVAVYLTWQYYSLIHVFIYPMEGSSVWDRWRLFLIGLGIHL